MIFEKFKKKEAGFLLLDSLASLSIVLAVLLLFIPLMTTWLGTYSKAKETVEKNRQVYERSMAIKNNSIHSNAKEKRARGKLMHEKRVLGIEIIEITFTYE